MNWWEVEGNWVLIPPRPIGLVHFLGAAFVATAPQVTYRRLLEFLADQGFAVVATPFVTVTDHGAIAQDCLEKFEQALDHLHQTARLKRFLPIYGVGHSMGCKLHLLIGSLYDDINRAGNIFVSFNNFSVDRAIPLAELFSTATDVDLKFTPTPQETNRIIESHYQIRRNLLIKFSNDDLDQTHPLRTILDQRFPGMVTVQKLTGNHLTPLGQDLRWQTGNTFTPFDAVGQWVRQEFFRELAQLENVMLRWLDPLGSF